MRLTATPAWQTLQRHYEALQAQPMRELFAADDQRAERFHLEACSLFLDYSKNCITLETKQLLLALARHCKVEAWRDRMFAGEAINHTEKRAVLHTALRAATPPSEVAQVQAKMQAWVNALAEGRWQGFRGDAIDTVVNLGIGGSDLGPLMACEALRPYARKNLKLHFVSNIDGYAINQALAQCNPASTLFIVSSKSFTTQETRSNAEAAKAWFLKHGGKEADLPSHFVAVSSNLDAAQAFGLPQDNILPMWDWVGGRYSLWSAIGLPVAVAIGWAGFEQLLAGARAMDTHFQQAPLDANMPVMMALLGIWYINFFKAASHAVLPYDQRLQSLPAYLQQLDMESNGKSVDREGRIVDYATGAVVWGTPGTNGQHAYFQLLHQGTTLIPMDFIACIRHPYSNAAQHRTLLANCLAQSEALMRGRDAAETTQALQQRRADIGLMPYCVFGGNRPSNTLLLEALTPASLGALIALYEHKVFVQGIIWQLNSFDQWGVEYGKQLAAQIEAGMQSTPENIVHSSQPEFSTSTRQLLARILRLS